MEQHPVPQHIASFEFKLFGNLTVRQFVTLAAPMGVAILIFFSNLPPYVRLTLSTLFGGFGLFAALVPIQGRPLDKWIVLFVKAIMVPTQRVWIKDAKLPQFLDVMISKPNDNDAPVEPITTHDKERLNAYLRSLPRGRVSPIDVKEQIAIQRLGLTYDGAGEGKLPPALIWGNGLASTKAMEESLPQVTRNIEETYSDQVYEKRDLGMPVSEDEYEGVMADALPTARKTQHEAATVKISSHAKPYALAGLERRLVQSVHPVLQHEDVKPKVQLASDTNFAVENVIPIFTPGRRVRLVRGVGKTRARKLHFGPPKGFDINNLPIRGEARFEVSETLKKDLDPPLFKEEKPKVQAVKVEPVLVPRDISRIDHSANVVPKAPAVHVQMPQYKAKQLPESSVSLKQEEFKRDTDSQMKVLAGKEPELGVKPADILSKAHIVPLTNKPNVLSGLIVDSTDGPVAGAIITVHDDRGVPVRALKTNKLGQFLSATPLSEGEYTLEIDAINESYEPLKLNAAGQILSPLSIRPK